MRRANDWLISIADDTLVPFGAVTPISLTRPPKYAICGSTGSWASRCTRSSTASIPDDAQWFPVYEELGEDMTLAIHAGRLPHQGPDAPLYAAPERIANIVRRFPKLKVIALHLGGFYMLDEAERVLLGHENVLVDTTWPPSIAN